MDKKNVISIHGKSSLKTSDIAPNPDLAFVNF